MVSIHWGNWVTNVLLEADSERDGALILSAKRVLGLNIFTAVCYFGQSGNVFIHYYSRNVAAERLCGLNRLMNRLFPAAGARLFPGSPVRLGVALSWPLDTT